MQESYVTNNHLRIIINNIGNYLDKGQEPPEDLFVEFIGELRVSNLLIPGIVEGDELISENLTNDAGERVIPLYTDDEEYVKDNGLNSDYNPIPNDIGFYVELVNENNFKGIIINLASESFFIPSDLLNNLSLGPTFSINDNFSGYGPDKLLNIAENTTNDSLVNFIRNSYDEIFDGLMMELTKSILLNVIVSAENLENYLSNGVIFREDVGGFELCNTGNDEETFGILFTSKDAILATMDYNSEFYYYYQIAILSEFFDYVLRSDMEGVIINPGLDDYFIPRSFLLTFSNIMDNPSFKQAIDYAFLLE
ncbi:SseB family protein [Methanobrevibacter sp.]|uniref:SseB family protein n=1 Tax=Methanobrevibacter sp. TaxID=66852 RepID=UPI0025EF7AEE|nr:SseB family protein [Methanobrevibacter sp.]MBQ2665593.1 SseB family protein [Methanobrevibacter sp.]